MKIRGKLPAMPVTRLKKDILGLSVSVDAIYIALGLISIVSSCNLKEESESIPGSKEMVEDYFLF